MNVFYALENTNCLHSCLVPYNPLLMTEFISDPVVCKYVLTNPMIINRIARRQAPIQFLTQFHVEPRTERTDALAPVPCRHSTKFFCVICF